MVEIEISKATRPERHLRDGSNSPRARHFAKNLTATAKRHIDTPACEPYFYQLYGCKICLMVRPFNGQGSMKESYQPIVCDIVRAKDAKGMLKLLGERTVIEETDVDFTHADKSDPYVPGK